MRTMRTLLALLIATATSSAFAQPKCNHLNGDGRYAKTAYEKPRTKATVTPRPVVTEEGTR